MKRSLICAFFSFTFFITQAQTQTGTSRAGAVVATKPVPGNRTRPQSEAITTAPTTTADFIVEKMIPATPVKNQAQTGTCWSFSTTSLVESQAIKNNLGQFDLSEWFTVRNIYIEKAKNYILRQGHAQFGEGGLGHDQIRAIATYGTLPEDIYTGMSAIVPTHDHSSFVKDLQAYLDTVLKSRPINANWLVNYTAMLDKIMGTPPESFEYNNKQYTPLTFASDVLKFNANDYVNITSFTHHPYYSPFILEVPDNFSNGLYYNLPLKDMLQVVNTAIKSGYSVMWDADVSNAGFKPQKGFALNLGGTEAMVMKNASLSTEELPYNENTRQHLFEDLTTQDDHLMHIVGIEKSKDGKMYYSVKNSWGNVGPFGGYIKVSEAYLAINTISLVVPKAALSKALQDKLKLQ